MMLHRALLLTEAIGILNKG